MADSITIPQEFFRDLSSDLESKWKRLSKLVISSKHNPSLGTYREHVLMGLIRDFLPERFKIRNGFIRYQDELSSQIDFMIIDESMPHSYLFRDGDFSVVLPYSVKCILEIKSTANRGELDKFEASIDKILAVQGKANDFREIPSIFFAAEGWSKPSLWKKQLPSVVAGYDEKKVLYLSKSQLKGSPDKVTILETNSKSEVIEILLYAIMQSIGSTVEMHGGGVRYDAGTYHNGTPTYDLKEVLEKYTTYF